MIGLTEIPPSLLTLDGSSFLALNASGLDVAEMVNKDPSSPELAMLVTYSTSVYSPQRENEDILSSRFSIKLISNALVKDLTTSLSLSR